MKQEEKQVIKFHNLFARFFTFVICICSLFVRSHCKQSVWTSCNKINCLEIYRFQCLHWACNVPTLFRFIPTIKIEAEPESASEYFAFFPKMLRFCLYYVVCVLFYLSWKWQNLHLRTFSARHAHSFCTPQPRSEYPKCACSHEFTTMQKLKSWCIPFALRLSDFRSHFSIDTLQFTKLWI